MTCRPRARRLARAGRSAMWEGMTRFDVIAKVPATYQDVLDAPPHMVAEIVDGALSLQPRPASRHALAASRLGVRVGKPFDEDGLDGGWWIIDEPELHFGPQIVVPDLAGWSRERMPDYPDTPFFTLAPDWVCEVLSPSARTHDLIAKRRVYAEAGVAHLWFVDPDARTLEAFRLTPEGWLLLGMVEADEEVAMAPFAAAPFGLGALWPPEPPSETGAA